jgi:hypothetical protein
VRNEGAGEVGEPLSVLQRCELISGRAEVLAGRG